MRAVDEGLGFEAAFLEQVENAGYERDEEGGVGGEQQRDVQEEPSGVEAGEGLDLQPGTKGGQQAEQERKRQQEDAESDGRESSQVDQQDTRGQGAGRGPIGSRGYRRAASGARR